ncbi:hypothetical protein ACFUJR_00980 [Streptomyces sp. NPDC057271]|uniref:hypothetical protein n=1 Tax=unclassified Streptomyces TaxID=2593676 RepID=UPI00362793A0
MNARRVNAAAGVVHAAMQTRQTAAGIAAALESACLLQSPESAAEVFALRARVAELEAERHSTNEWVTDAAEQLRAQRDRIAELETAAAALVRPQYRDRHGDTWEERVDGEYLQNVQLVSAQVPHENGWFEEAESVRRDFGPMDEVPVSEPVTKLRQLLAPQTEDPHDGPLRQRFELGRDLPEVTP